MNLIKIKQPILAETIAELQLGGAKGKERVVLWLGQDNLAIRDVYVPEQYSEEDMFRIPRAGISELLKYLRRTDQHIISQVHSHPFEAFHSSADDRWAIVRHVGAFSIVLPYFASNTHVSNFFDEAAVFQLSDENDWTEVAKSQTLNIFQIEP
jgi:hypothetical protein